MKQYFSIKSKYPDAILLFRVGDFYETYGKDAVLAVEILNIALTSKANGAAGKIEMAGFPFHALDTYLPKLVRAGKRVAICDQLEDPKKTKTLVKRGVTELVTPGVSTNDSVLEHGKNNFLAGLHIEHKRAGVAFLDISTGEFLTAEGDLEYIDKLLTSFNPKEVLYERSKRSQFQTLFHYSNTAKFEMDDWVYTDESAQNRLLKQFETSSLKGFGIQNMPLAIIASASVLYYMDMTQHLQLGHIQQISRIDEENHVRLDRYTIRNLELCSTISSEGKSLLDIIDKTCTPMGKRLLRRWILFPLKKRTVIEKRQEVLGFFKQNEKVQQHVKAKLSLVGDLERIASKVSVGRIAPREVVHLKNALLALAEIKNYLSNLPLVVSPDLLEIVHNLDPCTNLCKRISTELVDNPPIALNRGEVIRSGVNQELDQLRDLSGSGKEFLQTIQERESVNTGITSLKISFNNVFGYYLEVRNVHKDKVPDNWIRKQTLVNAERYITPELKEYEEKILGAEERIAQIETDIFNALVLDLVSYINIIQHNAVLLARLDCLLSFAEISMLNHYHKPTLTESDEIDIKAGRHPVIEKQLPEGKTYITNDVYLDNKNEQILIITGPNMAGKSALLRQTALIVIMAQMGCYVPAESAKIGLVDKIFTRVGASDNISQGESTFMVEMLEAADILNNVSPRSLVLFDELGRGTSTYDGISIAWAIIEHIHEQPKARAKTLFATHYHELNQMEKHFSRIRNYHISVKETGNKVIFLRKLCRGGSEHSFGIHVAKMAGMPPSIVNRANQILEEFEVGQQYKTPAKPIDILAEKREGLQLSLFQLDDPVLSQVRDEILQVDLNSLTPIDALNKLSEIKKIIQGKS